MRRFAGYGSVDAADEISDINVVPFVDVMMVLLVIFMITAPIITHTLDVQLPRASLSPGTRINQTLIITIDNRGMLAINEQVLGPFRAVTTAKKVENIIKKWQAKNPGGAAFLRADRRLRYNTVILVMAQLRRLGIIDVGLMIERAG